MWDSEIQDKVLVVAGIGLFLVDGGMGFKMNGTKGLKSSRLTYLKTSSYLCNINSDFDDSFSIGKITSKRQESPLII